MDIVAGIDSTGTNYNHNDWIIPAGASGLVRQDDGSLRTAALWGNIAYVGAHNGYSRPQTAAHIKFTVPYEVSGEIFLHSRLDSVIPLGMTTQPHWEWGVCLHPVFVSEDDNAVAVCRPSLPRWSASGQIAKKYGIPAVERYTPPFDHDAQFGRWIPFRMVVPEVGTHEVYWDGVLVYRVVEKTPPAPWWTDPRGLGAALRLDFYDYALRNLTPGEIMYPDGYGTREVTLEQMKARHGAKMHPEFARRFFAYIESQGGRMGVGGGWRDTQPDKPGFAPDGQSFHQSQRFKSGRVAYAAVDLVHRQPGQVHRSPTWAETADAPDWGLHTFISGEPWHIQCIEMRGWQTWVNAGRPDPPRRTLPGDPVVPPPPTTEDIDMLLIVVHNNVEPKETWLTWTGAHLAHVVGHAAYVHVEAKTKRIDVTDNQQADSLIRSSATTTACPPEWVNTPRGAVWTAQRA